MLLPEATVTGPQRVRAFAPHQADRNNHKQRCYAQKQKCLKLINHKKLLTSRDDRLVQVTSGDRVGEDLLLGSTPWRIHDRLDARKGVPSQADWNTMGIIDPGCFRNIATFEAIAG